MPLIRAQVEVNGHDLGPAAWTDFFTPDVSWKAFTVGAAIAVLGAGLTWSAPQLKAKVLGVGMALGGLFILVNSFGDGLFGGGSDFKPTVLGEPRVTLRGG